MSGRGKTLVAAFVAVFVLTVGVVSLGTLALEEGTPEQPAVETDHFQPENALPEETADGGEIPMDSAEPANDVVIHTGTGMPSGGLLMMAEDGSDRELSTGSTGGPERDVGPLATTLVSNGHGVEFYADEFEDEPLEQTLADADAFVTTAPEQLSSAERDQIDEFVDAGGRVVIAADPGNSDSVIELGSSAGMYTESGYLYNLAENDNSYLSLYAEPAGDSPLTTGVDEVVLRSAAAVGTAQGTTTMKTSADTRLSTTREADSYAVGAHYGDLAVIGDSSFLAPENAHRADNNILIGNVAEFLVSGETTGEFGPDDPVGPDPGAQPPDEEPIETEPIDEP